MSDTKIRMSDVSRRRFLLESTRSNPASITNATFKHLQRNLTYERLLYFLEAVSRSGTDCNRFFTESIRLINELDTSDIQKQPLIVQLTDNIMPKVSADNIRNLNTKKASGGIPVSDLINKKVNDTIIMDRILKNNDALSKRFDIDKIIKTKSTGDLDELVRELCSLIDTYELPIEAKYNIALENITYSLYKNYVNTDQSRVFNIITDYFLESNLVLRDVDIDGMVKVLNASRVASPSFIDKYPVLEAAHNNKRYSSMIDELSKKCADKTVSKYILRAKRVRNENEAGEYIDGALSKITNGSLSFKDKRLLMTSIYILPLIGKVSKGFVNYYVQVQDTKTSFRNKLEDQEFIDIINSTLFDDEEDLFVNAECAGNEVSLPFDIFDDHYKELDIISTMLESEDFAESDDIKDILDKFEADQQKSIGRFKNCLLKIYRKSPKNIIDETPHILRLIRVVFILGTFSIPLIGPALGIITAFIDHMISSRINDKQTKDLILALEYEKKLAKEKLDKNKGDKKDLEKYIKCLDKCIEKCDDYRNIITDKEIEGRDTSDDDDFDFDFDDEFKFESMKIIYKTNMLDILIEAYDDEEFMNLVTTKIPHEIAKSGECLYEYMDILKEFGVNIGNVKYKIKNSFDVSVQESTYLTSTTDKLLRAPSITDFIGEDSKLVRQFAAYKSLKDIQKIYEQDVVTEGFSLNTLKLVIQNFKKKIKDLSTKEKAMWQSLDANMSGFMRAVEKSLTSNRREAIIKGSIIPSFSKCLKTAIVVGGVAFVNPIAGLITAMGMFGASKYLNRRERQLIYDEIDTELKVVEKELQLAENDGDMKKYRFLLQYQKKLARERQRIKYGLKVHGRDIPGVTGSGDD